MAAGQDASGSGSALRKAAARVVNALNRDQKIDLLSGSGSWHTTAIPEHDIPAVLMIDGPHGLRKQRDLTDEVGLGDSEPATCFPPAVTLGSTWDVDLVEQVGAALGREARAARVGVLLGPGLNLKRHPAAGRNFEYFSEDPLLSGALAAAMVRGIQSEGVGACVKHFAANNQETGRMRSDSIIDERTLRELYLAGFEIAIRDGRPWAVMSSYNLINGEHTGESRRLLTDILRTEWGFDGLVMSDWFAVADRPAGIAAGMDLEMPASDHAWDARVRAAVADGTLAEADLDQACIRVVELALRTVSGRRVHNGAVDFDAHHGLARRAAAAGTVLLTNDGVLPLAGSEKIALIGAFADTPRIQGAGSSLVNPTRVDTLLDELRQRLGDQLSYAPGYDPRTGETTAELLAEVRAVAAEADVAVLVVGLTDGEESEAFDRTDLRLPEAADTLVQIVTAVNRRTVVVLVNGAPLGLPWADQPAALLEAYLGGQAGGAALADILLGDADPAGRLAESFPICAAELPASATFATTPTQVRYLETCHVGYRFHDSFAVAPRFCFGHGLSYTSFEYGPVKVSGRGTDRTITVPITNTGARAGTEVVQLYTHPVHSVVHRPDQELKAFASVHLQAGESRRVSLELNSRSFAVYDVADSAWRVEGGSYEIRIGASSRDIRGSVKLTIKSDDVVHEVAGPASAIASEAEFARLLGGPVPTPRPLWPLHEDSTIADLTGTWLGRRLRAVLLTVANRTLGLTEDHPDAALIYGAFDEMPLRTLVARSGGRLGFRGLAALLAVLNSLGEPRQQR
ncbi:MAG TPA: glycoside hydrolase family 3 C-terminal domain-containing protein [Propionicimonas sp.]|nr:glycoside hydrolase family 3 C-terminal domain-containing protein [Propionicimonas sp.]